MPGTAAPRPLTGPRSFPSTCARRRGGRGMRTASLCNWRKTRARRASCNWNWRLPLATAPPSPPMNGPGSPDTAWSRAPCGMAGGISMIFSWFGHWTAPDAPRSVRACAGLLLDRLQVGGQRQDPAANDQLGPVFAGFRCNLDAETIPPDRHRNPVRTNVAPSVNHLDDVQHGKFAVVSLRNPGQVRHLHRHQIGE